MNMKAGTRSLSFARRILNLSAAWLTLACPLLFAQNNPVTAAPPSPSTNVAAYSAPTFDVSTIKPHPGELTMTGVMNAADGVNGSAATLSMLVEYAYGLRSEDQISGGPAWGKADRFDVQAKMSEAEIAEMGKLTSAEKKARRESMMQALLAERFRLKAHSATKQTPVFDLVAVKGGSRLKDAATDVDDHLRMGKDGKPLRGFLTWSTGKIIAQGYSMNNLADFLSQPMCSLGRPVVDKSGLAGTYNFTLDWSPQFPGVRFGPESPSAPTEDAPSIFAALGDIGLKLQTSTGPVETIVIDHAERPTPD